MNEYRSVLERAGSNFTPLDLELERLLRRRDRKRRNQRIAAGAVGIVVFVAAIWIVTSVGSFDRTETPAAPGGAETGLSETGWVPLEGEQSRWLPPRSVGPSSPADGKLVLSDGDTSPWWYLQVYADGRVIWLNETYAYGTDLANAFWQERRLTPEGVDLVRSGVIRLGGQFDGSGTKLPASAWEDPEARSYVPSRYVVCASQETMRLLPQQARDLLGDYTNEQAVIRGEDEFSRGGPGFVCPAVTIEEARALDRIFLEAESHRAVTPGALVYTIPPNSIRPTPSGAASNGPPTPPGATSIGVIPLLPDGTLGECGGGPLGC